MPARHPTRQADPPPIEGPAPRLGRRAAARWLGLLPTGLALTLPAAGSSLAAAPEPPLPGYRPDRFWSFAGGFPLRPATGEIYRSRAVLNGDPATWAPRYQWTYSVARGASTIAGWDAQGNPHHTSEQAAYINPFASPAHAASTPFVAAPDHGIIRGQPRPAALDRLIPQPYVSGCMITRGSYAVTHGWIEARIRLPRGKGLWPAFWLLPDDGQWPPEIDIMEANGAAPRRYYASVHWGSRAAKQDKVNTIAGLPDLTADWHDYAVNWTRESCDFYFDRRLVARTPTPPDLRDRPCYLLFNLGIGGGWFGPPDATTPFPADLGIAWAGVWQSGAA